jgi:hypothetical protein
MASKFAIHYREPLQSTPIVPVQLRVAGQTTLLELRYSTRFGGASIVSSVSQAQSSSYHVEGFSPKSVAKVLVNAVNRSRQPVPIDGYFYDTRYISPNNMAHLMVDLIPICLQIQRAVGNDAVFVFDGVDGRFRELVDFFGLKVLTSRRRVFGRRVEVFLSREIAEYPLTQCPEIPKVCLFRSVYDEFADKVPTLAEFGKVFFARKDQRSLVNKDEVERLVQNFGYRPVYMEDYDIPMQVSIACSCRDVVAVHGAAMGFLVMNKHLSSVVEILPPNVYHNYFPLALGATSKVYRQIVPSFDLDVQFAGWPSNLAAKRAPFSVPLEELERCLKDLAPAASGQPVASTEKSLSMGALA